MAWTEDVRECVEQLPLEFALEDMDGFIPRLSRLHPANLHVREKIRQQLQVLRDQGELEFLKRGTYRRRRGKPGGFSMPLGATTSRAELAHILDMAGPAALGRGMFKRGSGPFASYLFLFHQATTNPYGDVVPDEGRILYTGQGRSGDQKMDGFNLALAKHLENGTRVHFFAQPTKGSNDLRYEGQVVVDEVERVYRENEGRSVLVFTLARDIQGSARTEFGKAIEDVLNEPLEYHLANRGLTYSVFRRRLRDRAFSSKVVEIYRTRCAVCGSPLSHPTEDWIDLQGAHVQAVHADGPDARNNGIALCSRHHWAFDHGIFSLDDMHRIVGHPAFADPHDEIVVGAPIELPDEHGLSPLPEYLKWHRRTWGFESGPAIVATP